MRKSAAAAAAMTFMFILSAFAFTACAPVPSAGNLLLNGAFTVEKPSEDPVYTPYTYRDGYQTYKVKDAAVFESDLYENKKWSGSALSEYNYWADKLPSAWSVAVGDPGVASVCGYNKMSAFVASTPAESDKNCVGLFINANAKSAGGRNIAKSWIRIYQTVRVRRNTFYDLSFKYLGNTAYADDDTAQTGLGFFASVAEDASFIPKSSDTQYKNNTNYIYDGGSNYFRDYKITFNSGDLSRMTITLNLGAPGREAGESLIYLTDVRLAQRAEDAPSEYHTLYANGGYKDSSALEIVWLVVAAAGFGVLCWFGIYALNKRFDYNRKASGK